MQEDVQNCGGFSILSWDIINAVGDTYSNVKDIQYCGEKTTSTFDISSKVLVVFYTIL